MRFTFIYWLCLSDSANIVCCIGYQVTFHFSYPANEAYLIITTAIRTAVYCVLLRYRCLSYHLSCIIHLSNPFIHYIIYKKCHQNSLLFKCSYTHFFTYVSYLGWAHVPYSANHWVFSIMTKIIYSNSISIPVYYNYMFFSR